MVRLRILEILGEQSHSNYWLFKQIDLSYQNFNRIVTNQTKPIRFEKLDKLSDPLGCPFCGSFAFQLFFKLLVDVF